MYEWILVGENARVDGRTRPGAVDCCLKLFYTHERYIRRGSQNVISIN